MYDLKFIQKDEKDYVGNYSIQEVDKNGHSLSAEWQPLRTGIRFFAQEMNALIHIAGQRESDAVPQTAKQRETKVLKSKLDMLNPQYDKSSIYVPEIFILGYYSSIKDCNLLIFPLGHGSSCESCTLKHESWDEETLSIEVCLWQETIDRLCEGLLSSQDSWIELDIFKARRLYQSSLDCLKYKIWPHDECSLTFLNFPEGWPKYGPWKNDVLDWSLQVSSRRSPGKTIAKTKPF